MAKKHSPYAPEFRRQMIELVRAGRTPEELAKEFEPSAQAIRMENGVSREHAYRTVQTHAMRAWKEGRNFRELVLRDRSITSRVTRQQIERAFDLKRQLRNIDKIFARVFDVEPKSKQAAPKKRRRNPR